MHKRLFIGNLDFSITNQDLKELFSGEGSVASVQVIRSLQGKSKGFGFIEMETEEAAVKAIEKLNQSSLKDRVILVIEAKSQAKRSFGGENNRRYKRNANSYNDINSKLRSLRKKR